MSLYQDALAEIIRQEAEGNDATREDFESALDLVFGRGEE